MKAIVQESYGSPDVLELREIDQPVPGQREVLVKVRAASVNTADPAGSVRLWAPTLVVPAK